MRGFPNSNPAANLATLNVLGRKNVMPRITGDDLSSSSTAGMASQRRSFGTHGWSNIGGPTKAQFRSKVPYDQYLNQVKQTPISKTRQKSEMDRYYRERMNQKQMLSAVLDDDLGRHLLEPLRLKDSPESWAGDSKVEVKEDTATKAALAREKLRVGVKSAAQKDVNEALGAYRVLRPNALPFYKEEATLRLRSEANKVKRENVWGDEHRKEVLNEMGATEADLPILDPKAYSLALWTVADSLADDIEEFVRLWCKKLPADIMEHSLGDTDNPHTIDAVLGALQSDPLRLPKLVDIVTNHAFGAKPLQKKVRAVRPWVNENWNKGSLLEYLFGNVFHLQKEDVICFLEGHIERVLYNQNTAEEHKRVWNHKGASEDDDYVFSRDFVYDSGELTSDLVDELNMADTDFWGSFSKQSHGDSMGERVLEIFEHMVKSVSQSALPDNHVESDMIDFLAGLLKEQFKTLLTDLELIGLKKWMTLNPKNGVEELGNKFPGGKITLPREIDPVTTKKAKTMMRAAARGRENLLEFQAEDFDLAVHEIPTQSMDEQLDDAGGTGIISDREIVRMILKGREKLVTMNSDSSKLKTSTESQGLWKSEEDNTSGAMRLNALALIKHQIESRTNAGPLEFTRRGYRWRRPTNVLYDASRRMYVREAKGLDPLLLLSSFKQTVMDVKTYGHYVRTGPPFLLSSDRSGG